MQLARDEGRTTFHFFVLFAAFTAGLATGPLLADEPCKIKATASVCAKDSTRTRAKAGGEDVKWVDGRMLPLEGKAYDDVDFYYDRLPSGVSTNDNPGLSVLKHHTAGMQFRFKSTGDWLSFRWSPWSSKLEMDHMPSTGVSGIDIYTQDRTGRWQYLRTGRIRQGHDGAWPTGLIEHVSIAAGTPVLVNLPLYNGIQTFELGLAADAEVRALGPRRSGMEKPVVFYGTSITQGGCCSRPGLSFVNIVGRDLDVPVVNLGFSDAGRMELEMSGHLARIDASCYVLDCLWNMDGERWIDCRYCDRYEPFIRNLRAKRPNVPIVMVEQSDVFGKGANERDLFVLSLFSKLKGEGWGNLIYLPKSAMYNGDREGTVDGCHPNDRGMQSMAEAFEKAVREAFAGEML